MEQDPKTKKPSLPLENSVVVKLGGTKSAQQALADVTRSLDFTKSVFSASKIIQDTFSKQNAAISAAAMTASGFLKVIPDNLTGSALPNFNYLFESPYVVPPSTLEAIRRAMEPPPELAHLSGILQRAMEPPPGMAIFSETMKLMMEPPPGFEHLSEMMKQFSNPIPEAKLFSTVWAQFNTQTELNWEPVLKMSATAAGLTALKQLPELPNDVEEVDEPVVDEGQLISLDEARDSVFATLEVNGIKPPQQVQHAFRFLWALETEVRRFIQNVMVGQFGNEWEKLRLSPQMYSNWQQKQNKAIKLGRDPKTAMIEFADFTDYMQLIISNDNWKIFEPFFRHKNIAEASFQRLFPYRLDTMHARTFEKDDLIIIAGDCQWLLKCFNTSLIDSADED